MRKDTELLPWSRLTKKGDYETLGKMLQDMRGQCEHLAQTHFSKNFVVNAILQDAAYRAARAGISFDATASVSAEIPISENELCALLMNMLDNAIEAASRCTEKKLYPIQGRGTKRFSRRKM